MRHYTKTKAYEDYAMAPRLRRCYGGKAESVAETKRIYRKRERAALKRMVAEEVEQERTSDITEMAYEYKAALAEYRDAESQYYGIADEEWEFIEWDTEYHDYVLRDDVPFEKMHEHNVRARYAAERLDAAFNELCRIENMRNAA